MRRNKSDIFDPVVVFEIVPQFGSRLSFVCGGKSGTGSKNGFHFSIGNSFDSNSGIFDPADFNWIYAMDASSFFPECRILSMSRRTKKNDSESTLI